MKIDWNDSKAQEAALRHLKERLKEAQFTEMIL